GMSGCTLKIGTFLSCHFFLFWTHVILERKSKKEKRQAMIIPNQFFDPSSEKKFLTEIPPF
ncbi:MAG: hypothetical protein KA161_11940, partial [Saprospiraceae bacterium]|nr:hypothetical protein [Saprospiraceae bacterium]